MNNIEHIKYTYKHRKIVLFLANKYVKNKKEEIINQVKKHDMDKMFLYLFYNKKDASNIHRSFTLHHENELPKNYVDYVEMVVDWESARYTKPDKPLNAYDTLYKYYPDMEENVLPILKEFGIDMSRQDAEEDVLEYAKSLDNTAIKDIENEMIQSIEDIFDCFSKEE